MAIGTTAAIIMAGGAALSAYGAHKQASAAKEAAKTQVGSAEQAKAELRPLYEQSVARMDPYAQLGGQAVGQLRALGGYPAPPPLPPGGSAVQPPVPGPPPPMPTAVPRRGVPQMRGGSLADFGAPAGRSTSSYRPPASGRTGMTPHPIGGGGSFQTTGGGGLVLMQAPDGEQREVPMEMVAQLMQAGARRLS